MLKKNVYYFYFIFLKKGNKDESMKYLKLDLSGCVVNCTNDDDITYYNDNLDNTHYVCKECSDI